MRHLAAGGYARAVHGACGLDKDIALDVVMLTRRWIGVEERWSHKRARWLLVLVLQGASLLAPQVQAKEVTIGAGSFGPYYMPETNSGIFPDIITAVFHEMPGFEPKYEFGNGVRDSLRRYQAGRVDAISNLFDSMGAKGCRTDPVFRFRDVVISKRKDKRRVESLADLEGLSIVAFDGAKGFFGEEYARQTLSGSYLEVDKQALQPRLLLSDRYDVNIGDLFIFFYGLEQITSTKVAPSEFQMHDVFPVISTRMGFQDTNLCPIFNAALEKVKASGEYERIYQRYLDELGFHR